MKIAVLAGQGVSSYILFNRLWDAGYREIEIIFERHPSRILMLRHRARKLGWATAISQIVFLLTIVPILRKLGRTRIREIIATNKLRTEKPGPAFFRVVDNINDPKVAKILRETNPDVVIVNGTRIIRSSVLQATLAPILNTHAGITPKYRGVHGGYWAIWCRDQGDFGVTIHLVDVGVDTGPVLHQSRPKITNQDTFATYPILQQAASLPGMLHLLKQLEMARALTPISTTEGPGRQWYHPTLGQYLSGRLRGVK